MKRHVERGFTLIEAMIVMFMAMAVVIATMPDYSTLVPEDRSQRSIIETKTIGDAAKLWQFNNGAWPDQSNGCVGALAVLRGTAGYLSSGVDDNNPFGNAYATSCTVTTFTVTQDVDADWAGIIVNSLPVTIASDSDTVVTNYPVAGSSPTQNGLVFKGTATGIPVNSMRTDLTRTAALQNIDDLEVDGTITVASDTWNQWQIAGPVDIDRAVVTYMYATSSGARSGSTIINDDDFSCSAAQTLLRPPSVAGCAIVTYMNSANPTALQIAGNLQMISAGKTIIRDMGLGSTTSTTRIHADDVNYINGFNMPVPLGVDTEMVIGIYDVDFTSSFTASVPEPSCPSGWYSDADDYIRAQSFCTDTTGAPDNVSVVQSGGLFTYTYTPPSGAACSAAQYPRGKVYTYCRR